MAAGAGAVVDHALAPPRLDQHADQLARLVLDLEQAVLEAPGREERRVIASPEADRRERRRLARNPSPAASPRPRRASL